MIDVREETGVTRTYGSDILCVCEGEKDIHLPKIQTHNR